MGLYRVRPLRPGAKRGWDPWRETEELRRAIEQIAQEAAAPASGPAARSFAPSLDLYDAGGAFVVRVDLPGVGAEDLVLTIDDGALTIAGSRAEEGPGAEAYVCCERLPGRFARTLRLPAGVDVESVKATLSEGVLEVVLPKRPDGTTPRVEIEVIRHARSTDVVVRS